MANFGLSESYNFIFLVIFIGLAPFIAVMVTSFIKIVVVLSLVRNAMGIQQIPPNLVINGLAIILSVFIMKPVFYEIYAIVSAEPNLNKIENVMAAADKGKEPLRTFLRKHAHKKERIFFLKAAKDLWPREQAEGLSDDDFFILIPAFTVSELTSAFYIGFLIYLPFLAIDLIVSNVLLAMGMMMVSPMMVSLPFKLLLFVLVNGWARLIHSLVLTYS